MSKSQLLAVTLLLGFWIFLIVLGTGLGLYQLYTGVNMHASLINGISLWGLYAMIGCVLFFIRSAARALYGVVEVGIALLALGFTVFVQADAIAKQFAGDHLTAGQVTYGLQIAAGMYIMVRGLDNIEQGLKPEAAGYRIWRWITLR